jgi:hypothetical protein
MSGLNLGTSVRGFSCGATPQKTKEYAMRSLFLTGLITASLALAGNGAMAANVQAKAPAKAAPAAHARVATQYRYPAGRYASTPPYGFGQPSGFGQPYGFGQPQANPQQIITSLLNSPLVAPYVAQYGGRVRVTRGGSGGGGYDPTFDTPASSPPPDTSIQDMLNNQAEQQAIDSMNEINAENASMAAAAAQTAADDAAMTQQIENNGGL